MSLFRPFSDHSICSRFVLPVAGSVLLLTSCVTTTSSTDGFEAGGVHRVKAPFARIYDVPNSTVFDKSSGSLTEGMEVRILSVSDREVEVETREGVTGFIDPNALLSPDEIAARAANPRKKNEKIEKESEEKPASKKQKKTPPKKVEEKVEVDDSEKPVPFVKTKPAVDAVPSPEVKPLPLSEMKPLPGVDPKSDLPGERLYPTTPEEAAAPAPAPVPPKPITPKVDIPAPPAPKIRGADTSDLLLEPIE